MFRRKGEHAVFFHLQVDHNETLEILNTHRRSRILCDVTLVVDGDEFPAHRGVLAANSNFFLALFTTQMVEKGKKRVKLSNIEAEAMASLLEFMYTGQIQINANNVFQLLEASNFLLVVKVRDACFQFLESLVDIDNCLTILSIADLFSCDSLRLAATQFIHKEFAVVARTEAFMNLTENSLVELLISDDIQIDNEEQLLEVLIDWIKFDFKEREPRLSQLLQYIRLPLIQDVESHLPAGNHSKVLPPNKAQPFSSSKQKQARKSYRTVDVILVSGGCDDSAILKKTSCFVPSAERWVELSDMTIPRWRHQVMAHAKSLYAVGGLRDVCTRDPITPFVERFNGRTNSWEAIQFEGGISNNEIDSFGAVTFKDSIILAGGIQPQTNSSTSRVFAIELRPHSLNVPERTSLTFSRAGHCMVTSEKYVYAIGGFQIPVTVGLEGIRSVECYNTEKDSWTPVQPTNEGRYFAAAVFLGNKIYLTGGSNGSEVLSSCEVYDITNDTWQFTAPMQNPRMKHSAAVHDGVIYVVGGVNELSNGTALRSVECYIPEENRWTTAPDMPTGRFDHQCSVVDVGYKFLASVLAK